MFNFVRNETDNLTQLATFFRLGLTKPRNHINDLKHSSDFALLYALAHLTATRYHSSSRLD
ncbi:hypothetical protein BZG20_11925 [Salinivibrio sp. IB868]|nr:hypothetical protein BZG20_11925 [Salinivibrio sp. IB868]OOE74215.1 hypothetical protein BZG22_08750 [Salinivibrio sp. IB870]